MRVSANTLNYTPPRVFLQLSRLVSHFAGQWKGAKLPWTHGSSRHSIPVGITSRAGGPWEVRELVSTQTEGCLLAHA